MTDPGVLPPDARLRAPRRPLPRGTVDCHPSDSSPPDFADMRPLVQVLPTERPDRCVWGTNWPHPGMTKVMPNDADLVDQLDGWLPSMRCANHYLPATPRAFTVLAY